MYSIHWLDSNNRYTVVGNEQSILAVYLMLRDRPDPDEWVWSIRCYDCASGLEVDPRDGFAPVK